jgi:hypothetical protein
LEAAGLALVCVRAGASDAELNRRTAGRGFKAPAFFRDGVNYYLARSDPDIEIPPLDSGEVQFLTRGRVNLPEKGQWLAGFEPDQTPIPDLPSWVKGLACPQQRRSATAIDTSDGSQRNGRGHPPRPPMPADGSQIISPPSATEGAPKSYPPPDVGELWDDPHRLARLYLDNHRTDYGEEKLVQWRDEFHLWDGRVIVRPAVIDVE